MSESRGRGRPIWRHDQVWHIERICRSRNKWVPIPHMDQTQEWALGTEWTRYIPSNDYFFLTGFHLMTNQTHPYQTIVINFFSTPCIIFSLSLLLKSLSTYIVRSFCLVSFASTSPLARSSPIDFLSSVSVFLSSLRTYQKPGKPGRPFAVVSSAHIFSVSFDPPLASHPSSHQNLAPPRVRDTRDAAAAKADYISSATNLCRLRIQRRPSPSVIPTSRSLLPPIPKSSESIDSPSPEETMPGVLI